MLQMPAGKPGLWTAFRTSSQPCSMACTTFWLSKCSTKKLTVHFKSIIFSFRMQFQSCSNHYAVIIKMAAKTVAIRGCKARFTYIITCNSGLSELHFAWNISGKTEEVLVKFPSQLFYTQISSFVAHTPPTRVHTGPGMWREKLQTWNA